MHRDWPDARGMFVNDKKNALVWVNEEDHMRVISMQNGGDIQAVFRRWCEGVNAVKGVVEAAGGSFAYDDHYGFLGT